MIPKTLLLQVGLMDRVEILVWGEILLLRRPPTAPRCGWAAASKRIAASGDDLVVLLEFANVSDARLRW